MSVFPISTLLALSLASSPLLPPASGSSYATPAAEAASQRTSARRMRHQLALAPVIKPMGAHVGELQEKWQFPSDHLPIGMTLENVNFVSWNVLDGDYMSWVLEKDSQGLKRSMIGEEHVYIGDSKLTVRDRHVVDLIVDMIDHPTHPRTILSLQECSEPFREELRSRIPAHFELIPSHGETLLVDRRIFEVVSSKEVTGIFSREPKRTVQDVTLRRVETGQLVRLVNVHLPGDPTHPGRFEFAQYVAKTFDSAVTTIAMGDTNFNELEMQEAMQSAFADHSPFALYSPYCTNIAPFVFDSKAIDHFFVYSPEASPVRLSAPDDILRNLSDTVALLQP